VVVITIVIYDKCLNSGMDTEILEQIGLSKNEIKVYFALLELDQSTATPIVRKSGIPNSKAYPTLEKLIAKGLVSFVIKNNVKHFQASDPKHLIGLLDKRESQIIRQKKEINELIPLIEQRRKVKQEMQEATVYAGLKGIRAAFDNILNSLDSGEEYIVFTLGHELARKELKTFFRNFHMKRIKKKIGVRLIASDKIKAIFKKYHTYKGMKTRFSRLDLPTGIFIYGNNVMTVVWGERPTAFVITSKENSDRYKEFFEDMWKMAKK